LGATLGAALAADLGATLACETGFAGALATGLTTGLATDFNGFAASFFTTALASGLDAGLVADLLAGLIAGLIAGLVTGLVKGLLAGLAADLGTGLEAVFLAGAGLLSFLTAAAGLALAVALTLAGELVFFTVVFELVLRGFFTSCLLAVAAYKPSGITQGISHLQMNCGHRFICVKTHIFRPSGRIGVPIKGPRQGADCSD
jgi:hypothetical protein